MLCQYVWEQQLVAARKLEQRDDVNAAKKNDGETAAATTSNNEQSEELSSSPPLFSTPEEASKAYLEYNTKYCLNYVRTFFNAHLDDGWFRLHLSPGARYQRALIEKSRANLESNELRKEILHSLDEESLGVIPKKEDPDCPLKPPKCSFVSLCRLGVGTKPSTTGGSSSRHHPSRYGGGSGHHDHHDGEFVLLDHDKNRIERHAKSHLHSFVRSDAVIKITDVPSYISHDQILVSMGKFGDKKEMQMYSSDVVIPTLSSDEKCDPYVRSVYVTFPSRESKENALDKLHRYNEDTGKIRSSHHHRRMPLELELEVDCSDVYGRKEVDADGYGGAPSKKVEMTRKSCRLMVSTVSLATSQPVSVLSAAVSSRTRIANDRKTVIELARQLDEVREITRGNRLNDLLRVLYPTENEWNSVDDEDVLDVSIAYLRRVHLFSFYNGCVMAESIGAVLAYGHPAGTIHLRLRNADDILRQMAEDRGDAGGDDNMMDVESNVEATVAKDMLVTRLNESIEKAVENVKMSCKRGPGILIDEENDAVAKQIEAAERETKNAWLENHGTMDEDGR